MDVTPHELRTSELREAWRGYRQDDVDALLERVAGTIERLQGQVERLSERVAEAENEAGLGREADEMLRRTLLLAQRTADAAVAEAQERARRVLSESEAHAHSIVSGAEEEARRIAIAERQRVEREIQDLMSRREVLIADVEALEQTARDHRRRLKEFLDAELARIESRPVPEAATPVPVEASGNDAVPVAAHTPVAMPTSHAAAEPASEPLVQPVGPPDEVDLAGEEAAAAVSPHPAPGLVLDAEEGSEPYETPVADEPEVSESHYGVAAGPEDPGDLLPAKKRRWRLRDSELDPEPPTDEFFRDLRQAVADEKPLGPRDELSDPGIRPEASLSDAAVRGTGPAEDDPAAPREEFAAHGPAFFDQDEPRRHS